MDCGPPGSSVHGISQARLLEWVAISFSRGSSRPRGGTCISCIGRWILLPLSHQGSTYFSHTGTQLSPRFIKLKIPLLTYPEAEFRSLHLCKSMGFLDSSVDKESACNAGDMDSVPGLGRSPGEGNSNLLQYSCQESSMDREAWRATVHGVAKESDTT